MGNAPLRTLLIITCLMLPLPGLTSQAMATGSSDYTYLQIAQNDELSLDEAARMIQKRTGGRVLSARDVRRNGNRLYEIRVLVSEGKVRVFRVDPASGRTR
ncbi:MAG: hypothetical protein WED00_12190 [Aquisalimonadaceae bacterium]